MFELSKSLSVRIAPLLKSTARAVIGVVRAIRTTTPLAGAVDKEMVLDDAKVNDVMCRQQRQRHPLVVYKQTEWKK